MVKKKQPRGIRHPSAQGHLHEKRSIEGKDYFVFGKFEDGKTRDEYVTRTTKKGYDVKVIEGLPMRCQSSWGDNYISRRYVVYGRKR